MVTKTSDTKNFNRKRTPVNRLDPEGGVNKRGNGRFDLLTEETKKELMVLVQATTARNMMSHRLGLSYKNDARDTYKALGYPKELMFEHYWAFYTREHIAKRVVDAFPNACWQKPPEVTEIDTKEGEDTEFEKQWKVLVDEKKVWHYMVRIDRLSGIGDFGILLLGFDGGDKLEDEVEGNKKRLLYIRPYKQDNVTIETFEGDVTSERYGLPEIYTLNITNTTGGRNTTKVHWSRIIHIADELMEDDIFGTPRMMNVYNLIAGLHLVAGGSGEMFWRGAFPGLAFILDKEAEIDPGQSTDDLNAQINNYIHDLNRTLKLQGMDVKNLAPEVADPSKHVEVLITLIAGAREIPKRILVGAERGELGGDRDENAFNKKVIERQTNYCDPMMVRQFVDRLIGFGVLNKPRNGYEVKFPDVTVPTEDEAAKVGKTKAETIAAYGNSLGAQEVIPPEIFLKEVMGFDDEVIERIAERLGEIVEEDLEDEEKEAEIRKTIEGEVVQAGKDKIASDIAKAKIAEGV
jgi:hypothetical protein